MSCAAAAHDRGGEEEEDEKQTGQGHLWNKRPSGQEPHHILLYPRQRGWKGKSREEEVGSPVTHYCYCLGLDINKEWAASMVNLLFFLQSISLTLSVMSMNMCWQLYLCIINKSPRGFYQLKQGTRERHVPISTCQLNSYTKWQQEKKLSMEETSRQDNEADLLKGWSCVIHSGTRGLWGIIKLLNYLLNRFFDPLSFVCGVETPEDKMEEEQ